jgi:hypothetical protein
MPEVVATADGGVQVKLGGVEEIVKIDSQGGASVRRQGKEHEILPPGKLLPLGDVRDALPLVFGAKE